MSHSSTKSIVVIVLVATFLVRCAPAPKASPAASDQAELVLTRLPPKARDRVVELRTRLAETPESPGHWLDLAMTLHANGEPEAAAESYAALLGLQPDNAVAMHLRSHALRTSGELEAAAEQLAACLESGVSYSPALRTAALWALEDGELERARQLIQEAFERSPDAPGVRAAKARIDIAMGDYAAAGEAFVGTSEAIEGKEYLGYLAARLRRIESGELVEAQPVAEPTWSDPWLGELRRYRGGTGESLRQAQAAIAAGEYQAAIAMLEPVHRWEPDDPRLAQALAVAYRGAQDYDKALEILERSVESQPGLLETRVQVLTTRFVMALTSGDAIALRDAARAAAQLREDWPDDWRSHALAGDVLYRAGESEEALEAYLRCSSLQPRSPARCDFKAARALIALGRAASARKLLFDTFGEEPLPADVADLLAAAQRLLSEAE